MHSKHRHGLKAPCGARAFHIGLLLLCLALCACLRLRAADFTFNYGTGTGQYNAYIKLVNGTASPVAVALKNYAGTAALTATGLQFITSTWSKSITNAASSQALLGGWGSPGRNGFITVPASSTVGLAVCFQWPSGGASVSGSDTWNCTLPYYVDGVLQPAVTFSRTVTVTSGGAGAFNGLDLYNYSGVTAPVLGTINLGPPPSGTVTVSFLHGRYAAKMMVDGVTVATVTADAGGGYSPNWVVTNPTPGTWGGKELVIEVNGKVQHRDVITLTSGTFAIVISAIAWEYPYLVTDPDDDDADVPLPDGGIEENAMDTGHDVVPDVDPIPGTDPDSDNTVDSDGAGPGTGLSVKDMYRAMRAALEDANQNDGGTDFDINRWKGDGMGEGDVRGTDAGHAIGDGLGALVSASGVGSGGWDTGAGGTPAISIPIYGMTLAVPLIGGLTWLRVFLLAFVSIFFFLSLIRLIRGAVTTPD